MHAVFLSHDIQGSFKRTVYMYIICSLEDVFTLFRRSLENIANCSDISQLPNFRIKLYLYKEP